MITDFQHQMKNECVPLMKPSGVLGVDLHGQVT
jgi:hypothetical protein